MITKNTFFLASLMVILVVMWITPDCYSQTPPPPNGKKWQKVGNMSDDFDGSTLDENKWTKEPISGLYNWIGRPPGLFEAQSVSVGGGRLRVTVKKFDQPKVVKGRTFLYRGGIVRSVKPAHPGYYMECSMKANATEMSSTFWLATPQVGANCYKGHELDIQECVGKTSDLTAKWAKDWDHIFHSNAFHHRPNCVEGARNVKSGQKLLNKKNHEEFFVYGAWWKSPTEIKFYLNGDYAYTVNPTTSFDVPMWLEMAMETYDWNPVPDGGGMVSSGTWEERTTEYEWIRTWKLVDAPAQQPFGGTRHKIPGAVEAEKYDLGGEGVAFHDTTPTNIGGAFRNEGVDIAAISGGHAVGWMEAGEWMEYSINVKKSQNYTIYAHVASPNGKGKFKILIDGTTYIGPAKVRNTGSWQNYKFMAFTNKHIKAGNHTVRFEVVAAGLNLNKWTAWPSSTTSRIMLEKDRSLEEEFVTIRPNPTTGLIYVAGENGFGTYKVINLRGQVEQRGTLSGAKTIDVSNLSKGLKLVFIENETGVYNQKILVQ